MNSPYYQNGEFSRLKSLLLGEEQQVLADIETLVRRHDHRIGDDDSLRRSVADVLAEALREADVKNHRELAAAIAPIIVAAIRREIRNASDEVVDAMYPIMGRLIRAYVASAIRDLIEQTNRQIESGLSARFIRLRIKSLFTRTPYRTLLMRDAQELRVSSVYIINRSSGSLIESWNADTAAPDDARDDYLIGGMLTAINNFAAESLPERESELRALDLSDCRVYLRASATYLLAIKTVGRGTRKIRRLLDQELQRSLEKLAPLSPATSLRHREVLAELAETATEMFRRHKQPPVLAISVLTGLAILVGLIVLQHQREQHALARLHDKVEAVVAGRDALRGFPFTVDVAGDHSKVTLSGLVPSEADRDSLIKAAEAEIRPSRLDPHLVVAPTMSGYLALKKSIDDLGGLIGRVDEDAARRSTAQYQALEKTIGQLNAKLGHESAELGGQIAELQRAVKDPLLRLSQWTAMHAVFFADGVIFRDDKATVMTLKQLSQLLSLSDAKIRVVGYTDPSGTDQGNDSLASLRAQRVAEELEKLGVPKERLKLLARPRGVLLSFDKGPLSSNRRVEFELAYAGEPMEAVGLPLNETGPTATRP